MNAKRGRLSFAILISLLLHALLLSLSFAGQGLGLPGFALPWQKRWAPTPALQVLLPQPIRPALAPPPPRIPDLSREGANLATTQPADSAAANAAAPRVAVIAVERSIEPAFTVPPPPAETEVQRARGRLQPPQTAESAQSSQPPETPDAAVQESETQRVAQRREAERIEADRLAAARLEAQRQDEARQAAARTEAEEQAAAQLEARRQEEAQAAAQLRERERLAEARRDAQRQERAAAQAETERLAAEHAQRLQREALDREAAKQLAAAQEARKREFLRIESEKLAAAQRSAQEEDERREARRRAMGRLLDEEAARRDAVAPGARAGLPVSLSSARRIRLWGHSDPNAELVEYAEAWARRIQLNTAVETVSKIAKRPHTQPMVAVALRSDGSVESINFVVSSGSPIVDEAIRSIVQSNAPYPPFPSGLSRQYDVIEIRRTWHLDSAVRLY